MRTLIVSHSDIAGGAGRAAYRLHKACQKHDIDSSMLVREKFSEDDTVRCDHSMVVKLAARIRSQIEHRSQRLRAFESSGFASLNLLPTWWSREINAVNADVVNLHWFGSGALSIHDVARIRYPVVMTLHDMWGFCGAEHYAPDRDDARWRVGYSLRGQGNKVRGVDINHWVWRSKQRHWRPVPIICPSRWIAECAQSSVLMSTWPIHVVPNVLDVDAFRPLDRQSARNALNLPQEKKIILFGAAAGYTDRRKGLDLLIEALGRLDNTRDTHLGVIFGQSEPDKAPQVGIPLLWRGFIDDDSVLAQLYSSADVMVVPSRQEAFGQTASEAQACGTPVVAFNATGLKDVVAHRQTGYLAEAYSTDDLARGMSWVLEDEARRSTMGQAARRRAVECWNPSVIVAQYQAVFQQALEENA